MAFTRVGTQPDSGCDNKETAEFHQIIYRKELAAGTAGLTSWEALGFAIGFEQGFKQGILRGWRHSVLRVARNRFGVIPASFEQTVLNANSVVALDRLLILVADASSLDDLALSGP